MEIYILNSSRQKETVVDTYESFIWTERWADSGDFQLVMPYSSQMKQLFVPNTWIQILGTDKVMRVERIEDLDIAGQARKLTISGKSLEDVLKHRVAKGSRTYQSAEPKWVITGTIPMIVRYMFQRVCLDGVLVSADILPNTTIGSFNPTGDMSSFTASTTLEQDITSLYTAIKTVCDSNLLGYRLELNPANQYLYFDVYGGTTIVDGDSTRKEVIFSSDLDTFKDTKMIRSYEDYKNAAFLKLSDRFWYDDGFVSYVPEVMGYNRRVSLVDVNIDMTNSNAANNIYAAYNDELTARQPFFGVDGEIDQSSGYRYNIDYRLGDIVRVYDDTLGYIPRRISEYIFVSDMNGDRAYPTLAKPSPGSI